MATNKGIHRSTPNSKRGRQMINIAREPEYTLTAEQIAWNKAVDEKKAAKALAKKAPKQVDPNAWAMERGLESF
jgi:hypothetical protein